MIIQYRNLSEFDSVLFRGPGNLEIVQAEHNGLCIEADSSHLDQIRSDVVNGKLILGFGDQEVIDLSAYRSGICLWLNVRELKSLKVKGQSKVLMPDIDRDELNITLSGRADVALSNLTADRLFINQKDTAKLKVAGDVEYQAVTLTGRSNYNGEDLVSDSASARLLGEARAELRANDELDAYVGTGAHLSYIGYPDVQKVGTGTLLRRRKQNSTTRGTEHG